METYKLGDKLYPNQKSLQSRMGEKEFKLRIAKEEQMLAQRVPPSKKGIVGRLADKIVINSLLPTLFFLSKGKLNKKMRGAYTDFKLNNRLLKIKDLDPRLSGLKIAHISDLHLDLKESFPTALQRFLIKSKQQLNHCDMIIITGDFQDKYLDPIDKTLEGLKKIIPEIMPPIIGVLGNHDRLELITKLEALPSNNGIKILINESIKVQTKQGGQIVLQGIDDPHYYKTHNIKASNEGGLKILLSHSPEIYKEALAKGINLCLSGHTHAGQLRLPWLGAVAKAADVPKRLLQGVWQYKSLQGHTSPGVGCSGLSIRLLCPPEITILELK